MEQVNLFDFPPVCLPFNGQSFGGMDGIVAGEVMSFIQTTICFSSEGWGQTEELSNSDTLKEVEVQSLYFNFVHSVGLYKYQTPPPT